MLWGILLCVPIQSQAYATSPLKPALVLVHGLGSAATIWKSLSPRLEAYFTIYPVDLPGHGEAGLAEGEKYDPKSLARMILDFMKNEYGVESMHVAGNSLGGWIALEMAALDPDAIKSVTGLAPAGLWFNQPKRRFAPSADARILSKIFQYLIPIAFHIPPLKAFGYRKITHLWRELTYEECRDSVVAMARSKGFSPIWHAANGKSFGSAIDSKVVVDVIFGDNDVMLPARIAQEKSVLPSHAKWIVVENCAHVIMWNYPQMTADFIKASAGF